MLYQTILVVHVLVAIALIALILIQHGKGADAGAAFGSGASATVFGSQGAGSFLTRTTAVLATVFFLTSLSLAYLVRQADVPASVVDAVPAEPMTAAGPLPDDAPLPVVPGQADDVPLPAGSEPEVNEGGAVPGDVPLPE